MKDLEQYKRIIKFLYGAVFLSMASLLFWYIWVGFYNDNIELPFFRRGNWLMAAFYVIILFFFSSIYGGFKVGTLRKGDIIYSHFLAILCTNGLEYLQIALLDRHFVNAVPLIIMFLVQLGLVTIWAFFYYWLYAKMFPPWKLLLICGEKPMFSLLDKISARNDKYEICEVINIQEDIGQILGKIQQYDAVIIGDIPCQQRNHLLKLCFENAVRTYALPKISDVIIRGADEIHLFDSPLLLARNSGYSFEQKVIKRIMDIVLSVTGLLVFSPLMLLTALSIKFYDGSPIIHKQVRLTKGGAFFHVYKFRSMIKEAEKDGIARLAAEKDVRVTPVGKVIRRLRLDELPQLINVLKGDMSLVGPRPERPQLAEEYQCDMPEFSYRLKVKGGLTGYAQIYGKYNTTPYDKLKLDLIYIENYSFWLDIKLLLMTVKVLFMKSSTEGVRDGYLTSVSGEKNEKNKSITGE